MVKTLVKVLQYVEIQYLHVSLLWMLQKETKSEHHLEGEVKAVAFVVLGFTELRKPFG